MAGKRSHRSNKPNLPLRQACGGEGRGTGRRADQQVRRIAQPSPGPSLAGTAGMQKGGLVASVHLVVWGYFGGLGLALAVMFYYCSLCYLFLFCFFFFFFLGGGGGGEGGGSGFRALGCFR